MRKYSFFLASAVMLCFTLLLSSCDKKQMAYDRMERFTEQLEKKSSSYDEAQWEKAADEFKKICAEVDKYKPEYTKEQKKQIRKMKGKCQGIFAKSSLRDFLNNLEDLSDEIEGAIDELSDIFK